MIYRAHKTNLLPVNKSALLENSEGQCKEFRFEGDPDKAKICLPGGKKGACQTVRELAGWSVINYTRRLHLRILSCFSYNPPLQKVQGCP